MIHLDNISKYFFADLLRKSSNARNLSWDNIKLGNHSIQWIIVVLIIIMTVCLSTLATLFFVEHYDAVRNRYYESMGYRSRQEALEHAAQAQSLAAPVLGSKQQSIAYSSMNDHGAVTKPGKKSTTNKSDGGGGPGVPNQMPSFPSFPENRSGTNANAGNNMAGEPPSLQQLNWNNIEFSFLYIYKLQQYYNELQKKVAGKSGGGAQGLNPFEKEGIVNGQLPQEKQGSNGDILLSDSPSNTEEDCDSGEVVGTGAGTADETNVGPEGGGGGGGVNNNHTNGDLKLDEEFLNRFLANVLNSQNQSSAEGLAAIGSTLLVSGIVF